jgi:hypothetical protein
MKFNRKTQEKERIINLIEHFYKADNLELEAIIYGIGSQYKLNYHDFVDTYQRLLADNDLAEVKPQDILNIYFHPTTKYGHIRVMILGKGSIKNYCNTNSIKNIGYNVKFINKHNHYLPGHKIGRVDVNDYHTRFNLKVEEDIDPESQIISDLISDWSGLVKTFRCKQIHTFVTQSGLFNFDLSIVKKSNMGDEQMSIGEVMKYHKQSLVIKPKGVNIPFSEWWKNIKQKKHNMVTVSSQPIYYTKLENSNVLINPDEYEIEVELNRNKTTADTKSQTGGGKRDINKIFNKFIEKVGTVLQSVQGSHYLMSETHKRNVINEYKKLIQNESNNIFNGPLPFTLEMKHIKQYTNREYSNPNLESIRKNYLVTEKANGDKCLLYIDKDNKIYLISRVGKGSQNIKYVGCSLVNFAYTLLDGEYITVDIKDNSVNTFLYFDVYYFRGKDVRHLPLGYHEKQKDTRQNIMNQIDMDIKNDSALISHDKLNYFNMFRKKYMRGDIIGNYKNPDESTNDTSIFESCQKILLKVDNVFGGLLQYGHLFSYEVNGLIFVPANLGVGQNFKGDDVGILGQKTWSRIYKWQSPQFNSIDFAIKTNRNIIDNEVVDEYFNGLRYKQVFLKVSYHPDYHNNYYAQRILNEGLNFPQTEQLINFEPLYPFHGYIDANGQLVNDIQIASIPTNKDGDLLSLQGEIIQEGNIIEFIYDNNEPEERFKWKPLKIQEKKKANGFHTAINMWKSMKDPITTQMITTGEYPKNKSDYQILISKKEVLSRPMKGFHNYIKNKLLKLATDDVKDVNLMDMCCGKLGDMKQWTYNKVKFVLAIDNSANNIHNPIDGAAVRIIKQSNANSELRKLAKNTLVIYGDCRNNISNGSAAMDLLNKYYLDILYGTQEISELDTKLYKLLGKAQKKFDIITCNFGIQYFFGDLETVENFMVNIAENLKSGGKFIGTCFDGQTLFNDLNKTDTLEGFDNNNKNLIWKIKRDYPLTGSYPKNHYSLGYKITTFVESMYPNATEYLVNFDFLVDMMNKYGLQLLDSKMFDESPTSFYDSFKIEYPTHADKFDKHKSLSEFSFKNRWFIFTKTKNRALSSMGKSMFSSGLFDVMDSSSSNNLKDISEPNPESNMLSEKILPEDIDYGNDGDNILSEYNTEMSYDYDDTMPKSDPKTKKKTLQTILNESNKSTKSTVRNKLLNIDIHPPNVTLTMTKRQRNSKKTKKKE